MATAPLTRTLLSLPRYAQIMGVNPVHFMGAHGNTIWPLEDNACSNIWARYSWQQSDSVSHDELARTILSAERDLANILGWWPAPTWTSQEQVRYPAFHRPSSITSGGVDVRGYRKSVKAKWGKFIAQGQRATALIGTATVAGGELVYTDADGDGFYETATITLTLPVTVDPAVCEVKVYAPGMSADPRWEIRTPTSITISAGSVVIVLDSWLLVDPDLQGAFPTDAGFKSILVEGTTANFLQSVDVYREYNDVNAESVTFFWEPSDCETCSACAAALGGTGYVTLSDGSTVCPTCGLVSQSGCLHVRDVDANIVVPTPAVNSDSVWAATSYAVGRDPDLVRLHYYSGNMSEDYLSGYTCDPLDDQLANMIAWVTTARLERELCSCGNVTALAERLRTDLAFTGTDTSFVIDFSLLSNPIGTRVGEVMAWNMLSKMDMIHYTPASF